MAIRSNHYEAAFEGYIRSIPVPCVAVDEAKRALFGETGVKNPDFLLYSVRVYTGGPTTKCTTQVQWCHGFDPFMMRNATGQTGPIDPAPICAQTAGKPTATHAVYTNVKGPVEWHPTPTSRSAKTPRRRSSGAHGR